MEEIEIAYIGFSEQFILSLLNHPLLKLTTIITREGRLSGSAVESFHKLGIDTRVITKKSDLSEIPRWVENKNALMYDFSMILPREITQNHCICNVHPGSLMSNRGAHPIGWSVLNGETSTCLSLHRIDQRIDLGLLIAEYEIPIYDGDDALSVEQRLFEGMPYILDEYIAFINGRRQGKMINEGIYHPKIKQKDYTIDPDNDTAEMIERKIRSQKASRGAVLETKGYRFYVTSVEKINGVE